MLDPVPFAGARWQMADGNALAKLDQMCLMYRKDVFTIEAAATNRSRPDAMIGVDPVRRTVCCFRVISASSRCASKSWRLEGQSREDRSTNRIVVHALAPNQGGVE
jgi:hypothetical protein